MVFQCGLQGSIINATKDTHEPKNQSVDGFVKGPQQSIKPQKPAALRPPASTDGVKPSRTELPRGAAHQLHRRAEKAHTLMRGALKKPAGQFNSRIQRLTPGLNPQRELRAKTTAKHSRVEHFGSPGAAPGDDAKTKQNIVHAEVVPRHNGHSSATASASTAVALPSMVASASHQKLERLLDQALTHADAHKQALRYQAARHFWQRPGFLGKRKGLKLGIVTVIILVAASFAAWDKLPQVSVKLADIRAHVSTSVPSYTPDGFSVAAPASVNNGAVVISFKSSADSSKGYDVLEKESNLPSASLSQTLVPPGAQIQTSEVAGNNIYIYGASNNAAWVNNGVLYTIKDYAALSSDQIIKIVQGLN